MKKSGGGVKEEGDIHETRDHEFQPDYPNDLLGGHSPVSHPCWASIYTCIRTKPDAKKIRYN